LREYRISPNQPTAQKPRQSQREHHLAHEPSKRKRFVPDDQGAASVHRDPAM
jgi:hypothetical protein